MMDTAMANRNQENAGGRLVAVDGKDFPLRETRVQVDARGGMAGVVIEQRFANPFADSLAVTYLLPLPVDSVVTGFTFRLGERWVKGVIERRAVAREQYEQALLQGRSAGLIEPSSPSLFVQEIGNIPPHTEVVARLTIEQRLCWLEAGQWEWRFPTAVAPRYLGTIDRAVAGQPPAIAISEQPIDARLFVWMNIGDAPTDGCRAASPTHAIRSISDQRVSAVFLQNEEGVPLDRDVVVRWPAAPTGVTLALDAARPVLAQPHAGATYGLLTVLPPQPEHRPECLPRDLIVLLDTSGSMAGRPLHQAKQVASALVSSLGEGDRLEIIEFSDRARRFSRKPVTVTADACQEALQWLSELSAQGGTEMCSGVLEALAPLRKQAQRQVVLVTDGLVGLEARVVQAIWKHLPESSRLHVVGIGSAVNRALTAAAARAGRGLEVIIGLDETPQNAVSRLLARTMAPLVTDLEIAGSAVLEVVPRQLPDLFANAPVLVALRLRPEGGTITVRGRTAQGTWQDHVEAPVVEPGAGGKTPIYFYGHQQVEDLEMRLAAGETRSEIDLQIERVGIDFQIATRLTSWVAVGDQQEVDPNQPYRRELIPHLLPYGMCAEGLGLRRPAGQLPLKVSGQPNHRAPEQYPLDESYEIRWAQQRARESNQFPYAATLAFAGRVALAKGRQLVVEIKIDSLFSWPGAGRSVCVIFQDDSLVTAQVDAERTSAAALFAPGQVMRLVLCLQAEPPASKLDRLIFWSGDEPVTVLFDASAR